MSNRIALPGLTSSHKLNMPPTEPKFPKKGNPFPHVGIWTEEMLDRIEVIIGPINETTSDFTKQRSKDKRHWKGKISFRYTGPDGVYESNILKLSACAVPYVVQTNYGTGFMYAALQHSVANRIISAAEKKGLRVTKEDPKVASNDEQWWMLINGIQQKIGLITGTGNFETKDLGVIFDRTQSGVVMNLDLIFTLKLTLENKEGRGEHHTLRISADCSRGAIKSIKEDIEPPMIHGSAPQQSATKDDIASQELIDELASLAI